MANPTTNFGWVMPTSTSLVTNLPADFNTFGQAVDTSMSELLGGTTGQVLSKTSNTNMDFTWVTPTDQTPLTTKGDLFTFSTVDARLAVGNNGETLVADSSTSTGLRYTSNFAAGKNKILNGDFYINQRNFTSVTTTGTFFFDRFLTTSGNTGPTAPVYTLTPQTFTPGAAPVAGYEGKTFTQVAITTSSSGYILFGQKIEDVRTFANQSIVVSFWAKAAAGTPSVSVLASQQFGTGGSAGVDTYATKQAITTSWARYSFTMNIPSISGKTIGTNSHLHMYIVLSDAVLSSGVGDQTGTFSIWGVQAEAGSTATAFQTATGTIQGELAACQRYYEQINTTSGRVMATGGYLQTTSVARFSVPMVQKRTTPTVTITGTLNVIYLTGSEATLSSISELDSTTTGNLLSFRYNASGTPFTSGQSAGLYASGGATTFGISAEL